MSTKTSGSFSTLLLSLPLAGVALMAIFGVPQFAPVAASPDDEEVVRSPGPGRNGGRQPEDFLEGVPAVQFGEDAPMFPSQASAAGQYRQAQPLGREEGAPPSRQAVRWDGTDGPPALSMNSSQADWRDGARHSHANPSPPTPQYGAPQVFGAPYAEGTSEPVRHDRTAGETGPPSWSGPPAEAASDQLDWRAASRRLAELGIDNYHLERGQSEGSFLFVCLFSQGATPNVLHRFEAEAQDPLVAVNDVLQQIDGWLKARFANRDPAPFRTSSL